MGNNNSMTRSKHTCLLANRLVGPKQLVAAGLPSAPLAVLVWACFLVTGAAAQDSESVRLASPYRRLAPGVEKTIPAIVEPEEIVVRHPMSDLLVNADLEWDPNFAPQTRTLRSMAQSAEFYREAWCLQFTFMPLRMIEVDVPQPSGRLQRKLIWYMVYRVTNTGARLQPVEGDGEVVEAEPAQGQPVKFYPHFVLETHDRDQAGQRVYKAYLDRIIPVAVAAIQRREDPNRELLTTAEMVGREVPLSTGPIERSLWGVATWEDVDPNIDFFSIYVEGLSNASKWWDPPGAVEAGRPPLTGRRSFRKTLQLNFWRPGDDVDEHEEEIRFGVPLGMADLYGSEEGVAYQWVYR